MSTGTDSTRPSKVCPYCGERVGAEEACSACKGLQEPLSRQASQNAMGPWFIRDSSQPFRPGCSIETVRMLVSRGKVTGETILRGPTTSQFWRAASRVPGVSHLLGVCYSCRAKVSATDAECPACAASFAAPEDRQHLGLGPVRLLPGQAAPEVVAEQAIAGSGGTRASGRNEKDKKAGRERRAEETYEPLLAPATGAMSVAPVAVAEEKTPGLSSAERSARLARVEAEARVILREQRERAQGRVRAIGVGIGLLLLLVLGAALTIASSIGSGRAGGPGGPRGQGGGGGATAPAPASTAPAAPTP